MLRRIVLPLRVSRASGTRLFSQQQPAQKEFDEKAFEAEMAKAGDSIKEKMKLIKD
jgi:hypothetical protein